MIRAIYNISWKDHISNDVVYGNLPRVSTIIRRRRLSLAGHVSRHDEPASRVLLWSPDSKRRVGRPRVTLKTILLEDTGLTCDELQNVTKDRDRWRNNFIKALTNPNGYWMNKCNVM